MSNHGWVYIGLLCFGVSLPALAQQTQPDTTRRTAVAKTSDAPDTLRQGFFRKVLENPYPNPERAALLSLVLPGAGQVYNRRLWWIKVPAIYAGMSALVVSGERNRKSRNDFQRAYELALQGEPHEFTDTRFDDTQTLRINRDSRDKNYQLAYIGVVLVHLVQTLEAYTTAHLLEFDMDESLTLRPTVLPPSSPAASGSAAFGLNLTYHLH